MPVKVSDEAERDIDDLYAYGVAQFGMIQADRYAAGLIDLFGLLDASPRMGKPFRPPYRLYVYVSHIVVYSVDADGRVEIMRVVSARSNWQRKLR